MSTEGTIVEEKKGDCLSCTLIRGVGCIAIGSYLVHTGRQVKGYNRGSLFVFGACFTFYGLDHLLGLNLINKT